MSLNFVNWNRKLNLKENTLGAYYNALQLKPTFLSYIYNKFIFGSFPEKFIELFLDILEINGR